MQFVDIDPSLMRNRCVRNFVQTVFFTFLGAGQPLHAIEVRGLIDARVGASDANRSWTRDGLDKTRFDGKSDKLRLGQAFLRLDAELPADLSAMVVASAADDRRRLLDINEAWLSWNPVPNSPWKTRVKVGAFFPTPNLEIDYDGIGWTPVRTVSSSAINSWIGEEFRSHGIEFAITRKGNSANSPHSFGVTAALFGRNDPVGTLLAWRGWSISDRITGLTESIRLADLPVYRPGGALQEQSREVRIGREIDGRAGYSLGAHYGHKSWLHLDVMHYDSRGDPLIITNGQYSWNTRFDHLSLRVRPGGDWEWSLQALRGETIMGGNAVRLRYDAWYALASHPLGPGNLAIRFDRFRTREHIADIFPDDPNSEHGRALALAWSWQLRPGVSLISEALAVQSERRARTLIGDLTNKTERSFTAAVRWQF